MQTATLGGLIKDYRIKKRLSQLEISLRIGWSDTTRLSKIEQGRVGKPSREVAEKIIKALQLSPQETGEFLLVGGYLPNQQETTQIIKYFGQIVLDWPYPAHLTDFSGRWLLPNEAEMQGLGVSPSLAKEISKKCPHTLELAFGEKRFKWPVSIKKGDNKTELVDYSLAKVAKFKVEQKGRENDRWYKKLVSKLSKNEDFRRLWVEADEKDYQRSLMDYEYKEIIFPNSTKKIGYHAFTSRLTVDPRFQIVFHLPATQTQ